MHFRSLSRCLVALLTAAVFLGLPANTPVASAATIKPIVFPVEGKVSYTDTFGACRGAGCSRSHEGIDMMGSKMQKLLAAVDGKVLRVTYANTSTGGNSLVIEGTDGWTYHYIHMNNDRPGTDDASASYGQVFAPGIAAGTKVKRGQLVGYMGDSGNAEGTAPHNHFEIRQPAASGAWKGSGTAINPYESLRAATVWSNSPHWALRDSAASADIDAQFTYGVQVGDRALLCDWDADGIDEPVIVRGTMWYLHSGIPTGNTAGEISFGTGAEMVLCGNVDGDPGDEPILFSKGTWTVRGGFASGDPVLWTVRYGMTPGDQPALGDWDQDGDDDIAIHRGGVWYLRTTATPTGANLRSFSYGTQAGDLPVTGDWDGDGDTDVGVYRRGTFHLRTSATVSGKTRNSIPAGATGDIPVTGEWDADPQTGFGYFRPRR